MERTPSHLFPGYDSILTPPGDGQQGRQPGSRLSPLSHRRKTEFSWPEECTLTSPRTIGGIWSSAPSQTPSPSPSPPSPPPPPRNLGCSCCDNKINTFIKKKRRAFGVSSPQILQITWCDFGLGGFYGTIIQLSEDLPRTWQAQQVRLCSSELCSLFGWQNKRDLFSP